MEALARYVTGNAERVIQTVEAGYGEMARLGSEWNPSDSLAVLTRSVASDTIPYRVAEMREIPNAPDEPTGRIRVLRVPIVDSAVVTLGRIRPEGYLIARHQRDLAEHLVAHGLQVEKLLDSAQVRVESFRVDSVSLGDEPYEGYVPHAVRTTTEARVLQVPSGTSLVHAGQPSAAITLHLLEPEDDNSFATTGWLSAEALPGRLLPVHRVVEAPRVPTELIP